MQSRVLVAYATRCGSTAEVAQRIGDVLAGKGLQVDVMPVKQVKDLSPYPIVILGSAVRVGRCMPEILKFVEKNQETLRKKSLAYFVACLTLVENTEENRVTAASYLEPLRALVKPADEALFGGALKYNRLNFVEALLMKKMIKAQESDGRNWEQIERWAQSLPDKLQAVSA